jgi:hypothetical protein
MGWQTGWTYRKSHIINPASGAGQNYQKRIIVHYGAGADSGEDVYLDNKCKTDFGDIRFTNNTGAFLLDYWIEKKVNSNYAICWIKILDDLNIYDRTVYIYYGNGLSVSVANATATFIFFDDFEINLNNWTLYGGNSALKFSGSNNLGSPLGFGTIGDFDGYSPFTLECWFRTSNSGEQPLITRMNLDGNGRGYCLYLINNHIGYELRNTRYEPSNEIMIETNVRTINDGNWHHVVATYNGSQLVSGVHIYLDGTEEPYTTLKNTLTDTISNPSRFNVATYGGYAYFTGDIDEIVVYTSTLALSDAFARYNKGEGTEAILSGTVYSHYTLDEGTGTDVIDISGHPERNLWLATAGGGLPSWITGKVGASTPSIDYVYSGIKSVKLPINSIMQRLQSPYGDKSIHIHYYDEMLPSKECNVFSIDAGESEVSYIGIINDIAQYEYQLQGTIYNSGIDRTVGWHEFIIRCTNNLKQFIIDGNLMPVVGIGNYSPMIFIINSPTAEVPAYWDTIFMTKFINPEPVHGIWGIEETGAGITTFTAEDIVKLNNHNQLILEDVINSLSQKSITVEDAIVTLFNSSHEPIIVEDILVALFGSSHAPVTTEDILTPLSQKSITVEDIMNQLSLSPHTPLTSEEILFVLSAIRHYMVQKEFITNEGAFPVIGGKHIINIDGGGAN